MAVTIDDLTGVWLCEEEKYIDVIAIQGNNAFYLYFTKQTGSISSVRQYYILIDPDNPNRILAVETGSSTPSVSIWDILEDGSLKKTNDVIFTKQ